MISNKVKLLNKEQLIIAIEQSGNDNIAEILRDKNLDGQELLDLTELKIINWKLTSTQKKELFTFINNLELNSSNQMIKHAPTNVFKYDTDSLKITPIKSINNELTQKSHSAFGSLPEIGVLGKKANFVQELNCLLSGGHEKTLNQSTTISKNMETDSNQTRHSAKSHPVLSANQTPNTSRSPIFPSENSQFHRKDSMNLTAPLQQNVYRTSPKLIRKPLPPRPGLAKSMGDLVNGWDPAVSPTPVPTKQKCVKKISDHEDKIDKKSEVIRKSSKKETDHLSPLIMSQISNVSPEVNRKPVPLPTRGIVPPPVQFLGQAVSPPIPSSNQRFMRQASDNKNSIEPGFIDKHMKDTKKFSLPILNQVTSPKGSFAPSLLQSPESVNSLSPEINRKPIPLPTRKLAKSPVQCLDQAGCAPLPPSKKYTIKQAKENKYIIEQDVIGKFLESDELQKKEEPSLTMFTDMKEKGDSTTSFSTFYIPLEDNNTSQGTAYWVPHIVDEYGYLEILQHPLDKNPSPTHSKEHEVEKRSQMRNEFHLDLSKAVKEKVVQKKIKEYVVQDHSHLSLIITPTSSVEELFDEDLKEEYTDRGVSIKESTACNKVAFGPLPRPPTRMVTPEFIDEDGYFEIAVRQEAIRLDNLPNDHYYTHIDGKETKRTLWPRENGSFLFRPSRMFFLVLTVKHDGKLYNFGIDSEDDGKIYLNGKSGSALGGFSSLQEFVDYFCYEPITFMDDGHMIEIYMNPFLGPDSFQ